MNYIPHCLKRLVKQSERTEQETGFTRSVYRYISVVEVLPKNFATSMSQIGMTKPRILYIRIYKSAWQNQRLVKSISLIGQLTVSSLQVATNFEKRHSDVIETIETLIKGCAEKSADLFIESTYVQAIENLLRETSDEKSANLTFVYLNIQNPWFLLVFEFHLQKRACSDVSVELYTTFLPFALVNKIDVRQMAGFKAICL